MSQAIRYFTFAGIRNIALAMTGITAMEQIMFKENIICGHIAIPLE